MFLSSAGEALKNPVQALVWMLAGVLAMCLECAWPGRYVAGAAGAATFMLGLAALLALPLQASGVVLLILSALGMVLHARRRLHCMPLAGAAILLTWGLHRLVSAPRVGWGAALALALSGSLTVGLLLDLARRSRNAKRQPINTDSTRRTFRPTIEKTLIKLCPWEKLNGHDDQDQRRGTGTGNRK